ncbi:MAG: Na+/H+ antiporter NhaC family protein [Wenzhouxiangellaceae bacterium]|nr:Na+/H+ antiporter NhaC family protein [Wenzhouxiangellaceae bacterium]
MRRATVALSLLVLADSSWAQAAEPAAHAGWVSLLPSLVAIGLALVIRQVLPALMAGLLVGAWAVTGFDLGQLFPALLATADTYMLGALAERDHASVILFTLMVGGMVGVVSKNGGMLGIVERIVRFADTSRKAMAATVAMGLTIFFDDYANTLVVGNTMRPITDRLRISREKLAYLVDSTAAPVACIGLVTTWVGYEVGLIRDALSGIEALDLNPYLVFLNSIAYSFYPLLALLMVGMVVARGRDFGPMLRAERRARGGQVAPDSATGLVGDDELERMQPDDGVPLQARNALVPIATLIAGVVGGMFVSGEGESVREIIGSADSYQALIWGSLLGSLVAIAMSVLGRCLKLDHAVLAWLSGAKSMLMAIVILVLAWALSSINEALGTAEFLVSLLTGELHPGLLPALVFIAAALTAFGTGSSWGTMGILLPLMVPLAWALQDAAGVPPEAALPVLYATVASVMGGAVWGDHCSPISDTTILSSMASRCDHIEHVRTQLPYALLAGLCALLLGILPAGFGWPWWLCLGLSGAALLALHGYLGHRPETDPAI